MAAADGLAGRAAGVRSYVSGAQQAATATRAGRYVFGGNNLLQEAGVAHDAPDTVHTIQSWFTPTPAQ